MKRLATALLASACVVAGGCGGDDDGGPTVRPPDPNDPRDVTRACLEEREIPFRLVEPNAIQVGDDAETDPRIEFFVSTGEAEGRQFQGNAQGAEHIGQALLFVREASDDLLEEIEGCLQDL